MTSKPFAQRHQRRRDENRKYSLRLAHEAIRGAIKHRRWFRPWRQVEAETGRTIDELHDYSRVIVASGARPKCPHAGMGCMCFKLRGHGRPYQELALADAFRRNRSPEFRQLNHHILQRLRRK
jgi:hypothetical protein